MVADYLATQGARVSAAVLLTWLSWNILVSALEGLTRLSLDKNGHHFADDIFKCTFMNEKFCILIQISMKLIPKGLIHNKSTLVGAKQVTSHYLNQWWPVHWLIYLTLGRNELITPGALIVHQIKSAVL